MALALCALLFVATAGPGTPVAARDVVADPNLVVERLHGPVTVVVTANPFRFPWVVKVNQTILSGPATPNGNQLFPTPLPSPGAATATTAPEIVIGAGPAATPIPGAIDLTILGNPTVASGVRTTCGTSIDEIIGCIGDLEVEVDATKKLDIQNSYESICAAQLEFLALQARTDQVLASSLFDTEEHRQTSGTHLLGLLNDSRGGGAPASCNAAESARRASFNLRAGVATVTSARAAIDRVKNFPSDAVASESKQIDALTALLAKIDDTKVDEEAHTAFLKKKQLLETNAKRDPKCKIVNAKSPPRCTEAQKLSEPAKIIVRKTKAVSRLAILTAELSPYLTGQPYPTQFKTSFDQLKALRSQVLSNVGLGRFFVTIQERCQGLYGAESKTTITVTRSPSEQNSVLIDCPSRAFTSFGFAFERMPQPIFSSVPTNSALPPGPPGGPTPPGFTVQVSNTQDVRTVPVVMFHVLITRSEKNDNGWYGSFGVGVGNTVAGTATVGITDYLAGVSYSFARSLIATFGFSLGTQQQALAGYQVGDPLPGAGAPVTQTRSRIVPFLGITYGPK